MSDRRDWLRKAGLGVVGLGLGTITCYPKGGSSYDFNVSGGKRIFLGGNENPYGPSPLALSAMKESLTRNNRYGMSQTSELVAALAKRNGVSKDNILISPGSSNILDLVAHFTASQKGNFITAEPTFNYWAQLAQHQGLEKIGIPLTSDKKHDLDSMLRAINADTRLVYVCNPNNPTGTVCNEDALWEFIEKASKTALVLVDEAYLEFTDQKSVCYLVENNENLVVSKTFSKIYGLAGARVGYAIGHTKTIGKIKKLQTWTGIAIGVTSVAGALAALNDKTFVAETLAKNAGARAYAHEQLEKLSIRCIPSHTNFMYFSLSDYKKDYFAQLEAANIAGTRIYEQDGEWSRITIGTLDEMKSFINALT